MALTSNCSVYAAVHEDGVNRVVRHIMRQRPSLFNYGTAFVAARPNLWCAKVDPTPDVIARGNPLFKVEDPLPVLGTNGLIGLHYCVQLTDARIDFHPSNAIALPPELNPPLANQRFALFVRACAGLGCPDDRVVEQIPTGTSQTHEGHYVPPVDKLQCFCLEVFASGRFELVGPVWNRRLLGKLERLEIVDIKPEGLENSMECYMKLFIQLGILPKASIALKTLVFDIGSLASLAVSATPVSAAVPFNPAVENDQLKAFVDMGVSP